jgi:ubiquinone/menaquinone biosynthesis C-methylase UbiE
MNIIIHKIFKSLSLSNRDKQALTTLSTLAPLKVAMETISAIILQYDCYRHRNRRRQDFIVLKLLAFFAGAGVSPTPVIADFGGGNGNVLSGLNNTYKLDKSRFICVETAHDDGWVESYPFDNTNISYLFWNNDAMGAIPDNHCDVVLCMVSLHHLDDALIEAVLCEIARILKTGGLLLIKEHDCDGDATRALIDWEHHFYHILECAYERRAVNYNQYTKASVHNFKSRGEWTRIIEPHGFGLKIITNRFLDGVAAVATDANNPSRLYWACYSRLATATL